MVFLQKNLTFCWLQKSRNQLCQSTFSVTARTQEYDDFPFFNGKTDIFQYIRAPVISETDAFYIKYVHNYTSFLLHQLPMSHCRLRIGDIHPDGNRSGGVRRKELCCMGVSVPRRLL